MTEDQEFSQYHKRIEGQLAIQSVVNALLKNAEKADEKRSIADRLLKIDPSGVKLKEWEELQRKRPAFARALLQEHKQSHQDTPTPWEKIDTLSESLKSSAVEIPPPKISAEINAVPAVPDIPNIASANQYSEAQLQRQSEINDKVARLHAIYSGDARWLELVTNPNFNLLQQNALNSPQRATAETWLDSLLTEYDAKIQARSIQERRANWLLQDDNLTGTLTIAEPHQRLKVTTDISKRSLDTRYHSLRDPLKLEDFRLLNDPDATDDQHTLYEKLSQIAARIDDAYQTILRDREASDTGSRENKIKVANEILARYRELLDQPGKTFSQILGVVDTKNKREITVQFARFTVDLNRIATFFQNASTYKNRNYKLTPMEEEDYQLHARINRVHIGLTEMYQKLLNGVDVVVKRFDDSDHASDKARPPKNEQKKPPTEEPEKKKTNQDVDQILEDLDNTQNLDLILKYLNQLKDANYVFPFSGRSAGSIRESILNLEELASTGNVLEVGKKLRDLPIDLRVREKLNKKFQDIAIAIHTLQFNQVSTKEILFYLDMLDKHEFVFYIGRPRMSEISGRPGDIKKQIEAVLAATSPHEVNMLIVKVYGILNLDLKIYYRIREKWGAFTKYSNPVPFVLQKRFAAYENGLL